MDQFIGGLQDDGKSVSEGEFTVSAEEALRKLREYQLSRPGTFASHLVASVVSSRGKNLRISATESRIVFTLDQPILAEHELDQLFLAPFNSSTPTAQKELAIAANGALGMRPILLEIKSWDSEAKKVSSLRIQGNRRDFFSHKEAGIKASKTEMVMLLKPPNARGFNITKYLTPIYSEIREYCPYAPIDIVLNGKNSTTHKRERSKSIFESLLLSRHPDPGCKLRCTVSEKDPCQIQREHDHPFTAYLRLLPQDNAKVVIVVNGINYTLPGAERIEMPLLNAIIAAPHFAKDISQANLLENKATEQLVAWLKRQAKSMTLKRCQVGRKMVGPELYAFKKHLTSTYPDPDTRPKDASDWLLQFQLLLAVSRDDSFEEIAARLEQIEPPLRVPVWWELKSRELLNLSSAIQSNDKNRFLASRENLRSIPSAIVPFSDEENEFLAISASLLLGEELPPAKEKPNSDSPSHPWFHARRSAVAAILGNQGLATYHLSKVDGPWRDYFAAQFALPDLELSKQHFKNALRERLQWRHLFNELAEIATLEKNPRQAISLYEDFISHSNGASGYWYQYLAKRSRASGSISKYAYWTVRSSLTSTSFRSQVERDLLMGRQEFTFQDCLEIMEYVTQNTSRDLAFIRFRKHRVIWALRAQGRWTDALKFLMNQIVRASLSLEGDARLSIPPI